MHFSNSKLLNVNSFTEVLFCSAFFALFFPVLSTCDGLFPVRPTRLFANFTGMFFSLQSVQKLKMLISSFLVKISFGRCFLPLELRWFPRVIGSLQELLWPTEHIFEEHMHERSIRIRNSLRFFSLFLEIFFFDFVFVRFHYLLHLKRARRCGETGSWRCWNCVLGFIWIAERGINLGKIYRHEIQHCDVNQMHLFECVHGIMIDVDYWHSSRVEDVWSARIQMFRMNSISRLKCIPMNGGAQSQSCQEPISTVCPPTHLFMQNVFLCDVKHIKISFVFIFNTFFLRKSYSHSFERVERIACRVYGAWILVCRYSTRSESKWNDDKPSRVHLTKSWK